MTLATVGVVLSNADQYNQINVGVPYANSTTPTDISPGGATLGDAFEWHESYLQVGAAFRVTARGIISTATGNPNLTLGLYLGGITSGVALATTGSLLTAASLYNNPWVLSADLRVDGTGTSGGIRTLGTAFGPWPSAAIASLPPYSSSGGLAVVNTGIPNILTVGATWSQANAANSLQVIFFDVERLNEAGQ
jgi:hypothetical protein